MITSNLFTPNSCSELTITSVPPLTTSGICPYLINNVPYNLGIVVQPGGNNICKYYSSLC